MMRGTLLTPSITAFGGVTRSDCGAPAYSRVAGPGGERDTDASLRPYDEKRLSQRSQRIPRQCLLGALSELGERNSACLASD
ncbi:MAG: hypothetical protein KZQ99_14345 [Candidatus Thiodiazotropha sp. (ex Dulcina madagascariensis)]|nr:hypothetical protein [Candidatus Thiodiazotropha sp. (ex Dulcina madagascariensis)]MCU7936039.1 hypothetical protein [Candidatus Thiodiazotropha sp. (ex Dulcina madagascariensis)]